MPAIINPNIGLKCFIPYHMGVLLSAMLKIHLHQIKTLNVLVLFISLKLFTLYCKAVLIVPNLMQNYNILWNTASIHSSQL